MYLLQVGYKFLLSFLVAKAERKCGQLPSSLAINCARVCVSALIGEIKGRLIEAAFFPSVLPTC